MSSLIINITDTAFISMYASAQNLIKNVSGVLLK